ncbi:hypothetical protein [Allosediminivita pacifica]|uniref:Uncharacterized protein n=1 Tax=Allosediminivita pacifica TaxID=1267769 RepID=A0A2T6B9R7_9RHOB|nr:hypothetical protein [Allosediminivita pacifica]PTX52804.1 hypothetical protein C8N44_10194 [Allosediminivita pacifica]GGA95680.1 hypothetical protein GCM10011324_02500 [Allosediminivita pacifica]
MLLMSGLLGLVLLCAVPWTVPWHTPSHRPGRDIPLSETYSDSVTSLPAPRRQAHRTAPDALRRHGTLTAADRVDPRAAGARPSSAPLLRVDNGETALPLPAPPAHAPSVTDLGSFDPAHDQIVILSDLPAPQGIAFRPAAADPGVREIVAGGQVLATLRAAELPEIIEVVWVMPDLAPSGRPI